MTSPVHTGCILTSYPGPKIIDYIKDYTLVKGKKVFFEFKKDLILIFSNNLFLIKNLSK